MARAQVPGNYFIFGPVEVDQGESRALLGLGVSDPDVGNDSGGRLRLRVSVDRGELRVSQRPGAYPGVRFDKVLPGGAV